MKALSYATNKNRASIPFDKEIRRIVMGEGAGILVLEELKHAIQRKAKIYAEVVGYGATSDAYHITSPRPDGEGAYSVMKEALEDAEVKLKDENIYINAHGTGTMVNDQMEIKAIMKLFHDNSSVYVSSTKSITGHCLGAAGSIELAISALALKNQFIPGTYRTKEALETTENVKLPLGKSISHPIDYVLSNSFAFAGNTACIILKKY